MPTEKPDEDRPVLWVFDDEYTQTRYSLVWWGGHSYKAADEVVGHVAKMFDIPSNRLSLVCKLDPAQVLVDKLSVSARRGHHIKG